MQFPNDVLRVLTDERTVIRDDRVQVPFEIDRPVYERMNKILKELGGRWDGRKAVRAHVFPYRIEEFLRQCLAAGEYPSRFDQGWYPTPPQIADWILDCAGIRAGMTVLEPSAGSGAIVSRAAQRGAVVDAVEVDERRAGVLLGQGDARSVTCADFLSVDPLDREGYDRVVMNPPFANGIEHILHAVGFLHEDAVLVSVMSQGLLWWSDRKAVEFRRLVEDADGEIEELPEDSFRVCGKEVSTCLVTLPTWPGCRLRTREWLLAQPRQLDLFSVA